MNSKILLLGFGLTLTSLSLVWADHVPEEKIAQGKVESFLCGIDIHSTTIEQAVVILGKPNQVVTTADEKVFEGKNYNEYPAGVDNAWRDFIWTIKGVKLRLYSGYYIDQKTHQRVQSGIYAVDVWGSKPIGKMGVTGQGLDLGDPLSKVKKIYGKLFVQNRKADTRQLYLLIEWKDGSQMNIDFDEKNRINHIGLSAEME